MLICPPSRKSSKPTLNVDIPDLVERRGPRVIDTYSDRFDDVTEACMAKATNILHCLENTTKLEAFRKWSLISQSASLNVQLGKKLGVSERDSVEVHGEHSRDVDLVESKMKQQSSATNLPDRLISANKRIASELAVMTDEKCFISSDFTRRRACLILVLPLYRVISRIYQHPFYLIKEHKEKSNPYLEPTKYNHLLFWLLSDSLADIRAKLSRARIRGSESRTAACSLLFRVIRGNQLEKMHSTLAILI
jgi:hypothetical protein